MSLLLFIGLLLLETIGSLVKPFSLCIRLFANMVAGHLVPAALIALIPFGVAASWAATGGIGIVVIAGCTALDASTSSSHSCRHIFLRSS